MLALLLSPGPALALTLVDLNGGALFDSLDGSLTFTFDPNSVMVNGNVGGALSQFEVLQLDDGFQIVGPFSTFDGETGSLGIDYTVTGTSAALSEAFLSFNGAASGEGAEALVDEILGQEGSLQVHALPGDISLFDSLVLGSTPQSLDVSKHIQLVSVLGEAAQISQVNQTFTVVPEPGTVGLLLLGMGGLTLLRRRA